MNNPIHMGGGHLLLFFSSVQSSLLKVNVGENVSKLWEARSYVPTAPYLWLLCFISHPQTFVIFLFVLFFSQSNCKSWFFCLCGYTLLGHWGHHRKRSSKGLPRSHLGIWNCHFLFGKTLQQKVALSVPYPLEGTQIIVFFCITHLSGLIPSVLALIIASYLL